jgi:hypothetical protein
LLGYAIARNQNSCCNSRIIYSWIIFSAILADRYYKLG